MTPDERSILEPFLQELGQAREVAKDPEAAAMIEQTVRSNPDAVYLLVQHAVLADQALHAAQAQIQQMQAEVGQARPPATSFFGGQSQGSVPQALAPQSSVEPQYQGEPYPAYGGQYQGQGPVQSNPLSSNGGLGGFLRSAGTMAAGVAAGDFLAEGLSNIFGGGRDW